MAAESVNRQPWANSPTTRIILAAVVIAIAVGVALFFVLHHSAKHKSKHAVPSIGPYGFTAAKLKQESRHLGTAIYWAGPKAGYTYEFTRNTKGYLYVRYLPNGTQIGIKRANYLIVVTYPFATYFGLKTQAGSAAVAGAKHSHSLIFQRPGDRKSVLMAFANAPNDQVEIFDPSPAIAVSTAQSGNVRPVGH